MESITSRRLTSLIARIVSLLTFRLFYVLIKLSPAVTFIFIQSSKLSPAHFVWLIATALIVTSAPLDIAALILFYYSLAAIT
jgi:hypothetical protein